MIHNNTAMASIYSCAIYETIFKLMNVLKIANLAKYG